MNSAFLEPFLSERINRIKRHAERLRDGVVESIEDFELSLRIFLSRHYGIPIFDAYFDDRTLDELIFEVEIIKLQNDSSPKGSNLLKDKPKEAEALFDDWIEEDLSKNLVTEDDRFFQEAKKFMETGKFIGEDENNKEVFDDPK